MSVWTVHPTFDDTHTHTRTHAHTHIMGWREDRAKTLGKARYQWMQFQKKYKTVRRTPPAAAPKAPPVAGRMHTGGTVPRTANFRLRGGEVVLNKTQLARLKKAKTAKTKQKVISEVSKRRPKKMKGRGRK
jgi:hypothetical protein